MAIATGLGVPRTTAAGWLRRARADVVTAPDLDATPLELAARVARLERRVRRLTALLRIVVALLHVLRPDLTRLRIPRAEDKSRLLRAIERSRGVLGLARALRIAGLSPSRLAAWQRAARACELDDVSSCPLSSPQRLTGHEVAAVRAMVTAPELRHVPTGRLALLAQRLGRVVAYPTTLPTGTGYVFPLCPPGRGTFFRFLSDSGAWAVSLRHGASLPTPRGSPRQHVVEGPPLRGEDVAAPAAGGRGGRVPDAHEVRRLAKRDALQLSLPRGTVASRRQRQRVSAK